MFNHKYVIYIFLLIIISLLIMGIGGGFKAAVEAQMQPSTLRKPLANNDVILLVREGLSDEVIISLIQRSQQNFDLTPEALIELKKSGVSNRVIEAMVEGFPPSAGEYKAPPPEPGEAAVVEAPPPPPLEFPTPPDLVVVPSGQTYVYMVPNTFGVYFFGGFWYRYYDGYWFRATAYNAPWVAILATAIPGVIMNVPPEYGYFLPPNYYRIHYNDFYRHWREWDRSRYWHRYEWYRHEMAPNVVRERLHNIERARERWRLREGQHPPGFIAHPGIKPGVHHPPPIVQKTPQQHRQKPQPSKKDQEHKKERE